MQMYKKLLNEQYNFLIKIQKSPFFMRKCLIFTIWLQKPC